MQRPTAPRSWSTVSSGGIAQGFSLVEILVVVVVMGVLLALLVPLANSMRQAAKATKCLTHMRQCAAAHVAYSQDNQGQLPPSMVYLASNGTTYVPWSVFIANYLERDLRQGAYVNSTSLSNLPTVAHCPGKLTNPGVSDNVVGMARNPQLTYETNASNYDVNANGLSNPLGGWVNHLFRWSEITFPAQRILITDLQNNCYMQLDGTKTQWQEMASAGIPATYKGPTRHGGKANYVFVDGHGARFAPDSGIVWGMRDPSKFDR